MRATFHRLFNLGLIALPALLLVAVLYGLLTAGPEEDWLEQGRYVSLSPERYPAGSVTAFAFDDWRPPRPLGFFLVVDDHGRPLALFDRVGGCRLEWRSDAALFVDACRGRTYPLARVLAGDRAGGDLRYLPVTEAGGRWRVDLGPLLGR